ncbi:hypothetical protein QLL95_gp0789 [Cotonvirus japonicus]|uniref:Uncharacterized protein n=1 Tax=Cotonvirus japonicus TaxID=2811091 RepID=A0ABM7NT28_9VIRU|nr:hypothetical protein QLL95_gp0789 [Cotonvirus japonicus]BCS83334.1 hypothetical protein [Cotonvirus japonicus]
MQNSKNISASTIKILLKSNKSINNFTTIFNEYFLPSIKIFKHFDLKIDSQIDNETDNETDNGINNKTDNKIQNNNDLSDYNFIVYITTINEIKNSISNTVENVNTMSKYLSHPKNHVFIVVDDSDNLELDDDDDLVFCDDEDNEFYCDFDKKLGEIFSDNMFDLCKISSVMAFIWLTICNDNDTIINLNEHQIDLLANILIKNSKKLSLVDKKREIKSLLKKLDTKEKLSLTGYTELSEIINPYFKFVHQKKIVCQNYLSLVSGGQKNIIEYIDTLTILIEDINNISFLKPESHSKLLENVNDILLTTLDNLYKQTRSSDKNEIYVNFLQKILNLSTKYKFIKIQKLTQTEISNLSAITVNQYIREIGRTTNLIKISAMINKISMKRQDEDYNENIDENVIGLFNKIKSNPAIIQDNISNTKDWIFYINECLKIKIPINEIIELIIEIITAKISYYNDITITNTIKNVSIIYPQCLGLFLMSNINEHFVFKKLYMILNYNMRFSGKNLISHIKSVTQQEYNDLLVLENKLLELIR